MDSPVGDTGDLCDNVSMQAFVYESLAIANNKETFFCNIL